MISLALAAVLLGAVLGDDDPVLVVKLSSTSVKKDAYRLAPDLEGDMPKKALRAKIHDRRYLFFDLDGNGKIEAGTDGFALEKTPFVVGLPRALLFREGQYVPSHDGKKKLTLTREELEVEPRLVKQAALLNEWRMRGARRPVMLDQEASKHAELHLDYLNFNGLTGTLTLDVHKEDPEARGYTPEGAKAGQVGVIGFGRAFWEDLVGWYSTAYHGAKVLDPHLERIGVARKHNLSILYPLEDPWIGREPVVHPADGSIDIPLDFSQGGEIPNPAPGTDMGRGCGFPLVVMLPRSLHEKKLVSFELFGPKDREEPGFASSPSQPASQELPGNLGCAFFVPERRLIPDTTYRARLVIEGMAEPLEWSFTTVDPEKKR